MPPSMKNPYFQANFEHLSVGQSLGQRANGLRDDNHPLTLVPTVHRVDHVDANAYIPRSYERPSVGTTGLPTVHRMIHPAYAKRLCVCRRAMQSILRGGG